MASEEKFYSDLRQDQHDIVIEGCDISAWRRKDLLAGQRGTVHRYAGVESMEVTFSPTLAN